MMSAVIVAAFLQLLLVAVLGGNRQADPIAYLPIGIAVMGVTMAAMTLAIA